MYFFWNEVPAGIQSRPLGRSKPMAFEKSFPGRKSPSNAWPGPPRCLGAAPCSGPADDDDDDDDDDGSTTPFPTTANGYCLILASLQTNICMHVRTYMLTCACIHVHICTHVLTSAHTCMRMHTYAHMHAYAHEHERHSLVRPHVCITACIAVRLHMCIILKDVIDPSVRIIQNAAF